MDTKNDDHFARFVSFLINDSTFTCSRNTLFHILHLFCLYFCESYYWFYLAKVENCNTTYFDSGGKTLVFSDDKVFSYNRVERRWMIPPPLGPTVWFPLVGSYFVDLGFAGLDAANIFIFFITKTQFCFVFIFLVWLKKDFRRKEIKWRKIDWFLKVNHLNYFTVIYK